MEKSKINFDLKIILVGDCKTGKSNFVNKYTKNSFNDSYKPTIVSEFGYKIIEFDGLLYRIQLWDIAGQDKNHTVAKIFAKESHGCITVTDATNPKTREK